MAQITLKNAQTIEDAFEDFIFYKNTQGVTEKTIIYYRTTFQSISKHLDTTINISDLTKKDLQKMIAEMRNSNLATNSIAYYVRALRVFLSWAKAEGLCNATIQSYLRSDRLDEFITEFRKSGKAIKEFDRKALPPLSEKRLCISLSLKLSSQAGQSVRTDSF